MVNAGDRELKDIHRERSQHKSTLTYLVFGKHKPTQSLELPYEVLQITVACMWSYDQIWDVSLHAYSSEHSG